MSQGAGMSANSGGGIGPSAGAPKGARPTAGPNAAGPLPGMNLRGAGPEVADDLMRKTGEAMIQGGQELVKNGMRADSTVMARSDSMIKSLQKELAAIKGSSGPPRASGLSGQRGGQQQQDFAVDTALGVAPSRLAGQGDQGVGGPPAATRGPRG